MTSVSRIKASSRLVQKFKPTVPDKLKGGKLERLGDQKFKSLKFKVQSNLLKESPKLNINSQRQDKRDD